MTRKQRMIALFVVLLLAVTLAACGGDEEPEPTDTPVPAAAAPTDTPVPPTDTPVPPTNTPAPPTDTPAATSPPAAEGGQTSGEGSGAATETGNEAPAESSGSLYASPGEVLNSFRSRGSFAMSSTVAEAPAEQQVVQLEGAYVAADHAYGSDEYVSMTVEQGDTTQTIAIYKVGDSVLVNSEGEWITVGRDNAGMFTLMADVFTNMMGEVIVNMDEATNLGEEAINGVQAVHYQVNDPEVFKRMAQITGEEEGVIESVDVNVWVATDGNYVVKYAIQASVTGVSITDDAGNNVLADQTVDWSFEIYDINSPDIAIVLPEDAPEPGVIVIPGFAEGEFPLPEGAKIEMSMFGMPQISSDLSEQELIDFYQQALTDLGWTFEGSMGFYQVSKGETSFTMWFSTDTETGKTTIQVITE